MTIVMDNAMFTQEVPENGEAKGHVRFTLKTHKPEDVALVGFCANITASLLFERMKAQGTNIIIALSRDTCRVDILARQENDGLDFQWAPKTIDPSQLSEIQERIRNKTFLLGKSEKPKSPPTVPQSSQPPSQLSLAHPPNTQQHIATHTPSTPPPPNKEEHELSEAEEDYLVKQLHRIP